MLSTTSAQPTSAPTAARPVAADRSESFEAHLDAVLPRAYAAARSLTRDSADAEDLVQDAALLALRGFDGFEPGTNFRAWFLRILTNAFYARYRKDQRRIGTVSLDEPEDLFLYGKLAAPESPEHDPARAFMSRLDTEAVVEALQALPPDFRVVATLYFLQEQTYEEIAATLGCPVGTVRSRLHRSRRLLQQSLWRVAEEHGLV